MRFYLLTVLLTGAATLAFTWAVWRIGMRFKLYPEIRERDVHTTPKPRVGGVAMFLGVLVAFALSSQIPYFSIFWADPAVIWSLLGASALIVVVGVADDLFDLDWMIKLGAQFLAAGIVVGFGGIQIFFIPFGQQFVVSSFASFAMSVVAIVIVMNAVNFIDGLDGLVAGVALISNAVFFVYSYLVARDTGASSYSSLASFIAVALIGVCIGFLPLNWNPSKLFIGRLRSAAARPSHGVVGDRVPGNLPPALLGDNDVFGRSQLLGAFIPILLPVVVVLLPLLDFGMAIVRRMARGKSPFSPDRKHLHHRMLDMGHSDRDAVLIFYAWTAVVSVACCSCTSARPRRGRVTTGSASWFVLIGVAACLVVTRSRPCVRPRHRPVPPRCPIRPRGIHDLPLQHPRPAHTLLWSAAATAALAVAGAIIGFAVAGASGCGARSSPSSSPPCSSASPRDDTDREPVVRRRALVPIFFGAVMGGWLLKFVVFLVVLFLLRDSRGSTPESSRGAGGQCGRFPRHRRGRHDPDAHPRRQRRDAAHPCGYRRRGRQPAPPEEGGCRERYVARGR
ncbi:hypothetical protein GCM10023065_31940 [Microbacterium laevaniformans]|uniref:MraY family glycosyltransferase n=1 Tax=Microbacterium laevaniformans TaxID=36807 RepID=UPI0031F149DD